MEHKRPLAPILVGTGTLSDPRDMLRALETLESVEYRFEAHGDQIDEGVATLVKLMADTASSTMIVNGCLFLNIASFRYLDFERTAEGRWRFTLHADATTLSLTHIPEPAEETETTRSRLLFEEEADAFESLLILDDEDDED